MNLSFWTQAIFVGLIGLCFGSFLNVVVIRLPRGRSLIKPSSRCGFCRSRISTFSNLPLLGFLFSAGMCRKCGHPYSSRYFFVELLMGLLALATWDVFGWNSTFFLVLSFVGLLVAISFIDMELRLIPDFLSLGGWAVALMVAALGLSGFPLFDRSLMGPQMPLFFQSALSSIFGYGLFWTLSRFYAFARKEEGLGGGDVKLMGLVGAVLGIPGVVSTTLIGSILALAVGGVAILFQRKTKHFPIPFGPALAIGALVTTFGLDRWIWP